MPLLHTALQEGFTGDEVVLEINGAEVFRKRDVRTRTQIGRAATYEQQVPPGSVALGISLPNRQLQHTVALEVTRDTYVGVSVAADGNIEHIVSHEAFGYV